MKRLRKKKTIYSQSLASNPRIEKRRRLLLERRNLQLIHLWRIVIYCSITYSLSLLVLNYGWSNIDVGEISIKGSQNIKPSSIVITSGINFPKPLFTIDPEELKANLVNELPVKSISIRRSLIPPRIEIEVQERQPIAYADRRGPEGKENGMIDQYGYWIPIRMKKYTHPPSGKAYVEGWMPTHQNWISMILRNLENLGSPLNRIIVNPSGEISLRTIDFELIHLGTNSSYLEEQIKAIQQLSKNLPTSFINQKGTILDLRDPSKPEFQIKSN